MLEADAAITQIAMNGSNRFVGDERVYAEFFLHPRKNEQKSLAEGRDIFEEVPYVRVLVPGDKDNIVVRPVRNSDKARWAKQWQAFENREDAPMEGTPLDEWAGVSRSMVEELKFFNIRTVEDLVAMPDAHASKFLGINGLRQKASAWLEDAQYSAPIAQLQQENEDLRGQIENMQLQMAELMERLEED